MDSCICFSPWVMDVLQVGSGAVLGIGLFLVYAVAKHNKKKKGSDGRGPR